MWRALLDKKPVAFALDLKETYDRVGVARAAAALSYFLILTLFPLLMCVNFFIGLLPLEPEDVFFALEPLLPQESLNIILDYLTYVSSIPQNQSTPLLLASLFTILLSASAALRTLFQTMDELYEVPRDNSVKRLVLSVVLSLLFLLTLYLSIIVVFTGDWFFQALERTLPQKILELIPLHMLVSFWTQLRYVLLFCFVLLLVLAIYRLGTPRRFQGHHPPHRPALRPGHGGLLGALLLVYRHVLPLLPGVRLFGLPYYPAGVALLLRQHPGDRRGGGPGVDPGPLARGSHITNHSAARQKVVFGGPLALSFFQFLC